MCWATFPSSGLWEFSVFSPFPPMVSLKLSSFAFHLQKQTLDILLAFLSQPFATVRLQSISLEWGVLFHRRISLHVLVSVDSSTGVQSLSRCSLENIAIHERLWLGWVLFFLLFFRKMIRKEAWAEQNLRAGLNQDSFTESWPDMVSVV